MGGVVPAWRREPTAAGRQLRALREAAGLNQQQLAAASGLYHELVSRLETGRLAANAKTVRTLSRALGVTPNQLVSDSPRGPTQLTVAEATRLLAVPPARLQIWLKKGLVEGTKVSGQRRVLAIVVVELARSGRLRGQSNRLDPRYRG